VPVFNKQWSREIEIEEFSREDLDRLKRVQCLSSVMNNPTRSLISDVKNYINSEYLNDFESPLQRSALPEPNLNEFKGYISKIENVYRKYAKH